MNKELIYIKILEEAGVGRRQAEAHIDVLGKAMLDDVAKNSDLIAFRKATRAEFQIFRNEMAAEFETFRSEMAAEFKLVRAEMKSMGKSIIIGNAVVIATILALYRAFEHYLS